MIVVLDPRLTHTAGPPGEGGGIGCGGVVDEPGEVVDAVAVSPNVVGDR